MMVGRDTSQGTFGPAPQGECVICQQDLSAGWGGGGPGRNVTGAMCDDCFRNFRAQSGMRLEEFLEGLTAPVLLLDSSSRVLFANKLALGMLGKQQQQAKGFLSGEVFECEYARLPGGCGQTIHCSGCTIRIAVTGTFLTGIGVQDSPAYLNRKMSTRSVCLDLHITTEKAYGMVLLQIDGMGEEHKGDQGLQ